jgi:hypothetical protein
MSRDDDLQSAGEPQPIAPAAAEEPAAGRSGRLPIYISALVICQDAFRDDRGRTHLHAVFDNLNAGGFPINVQFMVWVSLKGRGTGRVVLKIVDTLEATLALTEPLIAEVTPFKGHEFFYGFSLLFAGAGLYKVIGYVDGIPSMEVPLMVRFAPPGNQVLSPGS